MKKRAYTLAEVLIALGIVGIISAIMIALINKAAPDMNKITYLKAYDSLVKSVKSMAHDPELYNSTFNFTWQDGDRAIVLLNVHKYPFLNPDTPVKEGFTDPELYSGVNKFDNLLKSALNGKDTSSGSNFNFVTTQNNISWGVNTDTWSYSDPYFAATPNHDSVPLRFGSTITIDINGENVSPNMEFDRTDDIFAQKGKTPDRFSFYVTESGKVYPVDEYGQYYLKTRRSWTKNKGALEYITSHNLQRRPTGPNTIPITNNIVVGYAEDPNGGENPGGGDPGGGDPPIDPVDPPVGPVYPVEPVPINPVKPIDPVGPVGPIDPDPDPTPPAPDPNPDGSTSDVSGSDLPVLSYMQLVAALANWHGATRLNASWTLLNNLIQHMPVGPNHYSNAITSTAAWVNFKNEAYSNMSKIIDEMYEDIVEYYLEHVVSDQTSALTQNYEIHVNSAYLKRLADVRDSLKNSYGSQMSDADSRFPGQFSYSIHNTYGNAYKVDRQFVATSIVGDYAVVYATNPHSEGPFAGGAIGNNYLLDRYGSGENINIPEYINYNTNELYSNSASLNFMMYPYPEYQPYHATMQQCYVKYAINKESVRHKVIQHHNLFIISQDHNGDFMISNTSDTYGLGSQFRGLYRLGNPNPNSYYNRLTSTSGAAAKAKEKLTERLTTIGTAMKNKGYSQATVDAAIDTTNAQYTNMLNKIATLGSTITGSDVPTGFSTLSMPNIVPNTTFGIVKFTTVATCNSMPAPLTGSSGLVVRVATVSATSSRWAIDIDQAKLLERVVTNMNSIRN